MQRPFDSVPTGPVDFAISDVPIAPVAVSFVSEPPEGVPEPAPRRIPERASAARRVAGWTIDLTFLALGLAAHVFVAVQLGGMPRSAPELLLGAPALWASLGGALAVAWSWVFVALWGRTPGMAFTGQRLRTLEGRPLGPIAAFARALLAVLSGVLGLFGFLLALFDLRGQTLHDKLCGCVAIVE
jgi:resuscitation-promoting factor RpfA